jgi:hypothetical protein
MYYKTIHIVRRAKALFFSGCKSRPATFAPAGSNQSRDLVREPDAGEPPVRFDERGVETELWQGYTGTV